MNNQYKKLVTDINRQADLEKNLPLYEESLEAMYNQYATVKMCMNYFTMKEIIAECEIKRSDSVKYFDIITDLIKKHVIEHQKVEEASIQAIRQIRDNIEYKMKVLTSFADGYEIYEYILNRVEAGILGTASEVDAGALSAQIFQYIFSEQDTVVINSKLQLIMAQLPIRMTKSKFFDIISNTLSIYKGGERQAVDDFVDMLRVTALIKKPAGFKTEYPYLYKVYKALTEANYKELNEEQYNELRTGLESAAAIINNEVSDYMLLQEIVNDTYTILLVNDSSYAKCEEDLQYRACIRILTECISCDNMDILPESMTEEFFAIEGAQESFSSNVMILEGALEQCKANNSEKLKELGLSDSFRKLEDVEKLLSTSLFVSLDEENISHAAADTDYINEVKDGFIEELRGLFEEQSKPVSRSIMCKLIAQMPIFLNTQQEIKDFLDYTLTGCSDASTMTGTQKLILELIEEE